MSQVFESTRLVEFRDTDMAGIVHFSVFFTYMEQAEHELLRSVGLGVVSRIDGRDISWPRVAAECNFRRAIKFEQSITIRVTIERIGDKSITYLYEFLNDGQTVAEGKITAVCCLFKHGSNPVSIEIPSFVRKKLSSFVKKL
jgi:4-hydroxybenzoyl-CoA thioesterase/acyl-CoA thioester hydrolase